ncbi:MULTISPECIES: hypothetical protein [unclassified Paenibacillus]|uniref:hypothetical protein n=1 Tax=unclassified Paenibacillus TaxID=185978 RepID=UPI000CFD1445|nr:MULTISPECIES: hypothetical protein [unclassified Paenibacillus]PRA08806.1 hypothetical protein CQ043_02170 [Paenibacillus sp. MYb63]PRA48740.1 hypothetical protein CQ061_10625 [Paenibacillus sp. MYb67]QZN73077.1 hypothetical protein K5K90_16540 [Paenibacillus sp. DR312]
MNRRSLILGLLSVCTALTVVACSTRTEDQALSATIESKLQQMVSDPVLVTNSNPNDYIGGNREVYDDILNTGEEGLHLLLQQLESSPDNGLKEWIVAQASTELLGEINPVEDWHSGKDWLRQYKMNVE